MALLLLTAALCLALVPCQSFNVDVKHPTTFEDPAKGFGQSVVQFRTDRDNLVIVSAPFQKSGVNETGLLYQCNPSSGRCQPTNIPLPPEAVDIHLGLSLAAQLSPGRLLACGPTLKRTCGENTYINGLCFLLDQNLQRMKQLPETLIECSSGIDIVFLIDGSGSIKTFEFPLMLNFVKQVMDTFQNTDAAFALMQYSDRFEIHFDFNRFRSIRNPDTLLRGIVHQRGATHTPSAILRVMSDLFVERSGARNSATKLLIVITDGETFGDSIRLPPVIQEAERRGIIRYAIGVGAAFSKQKALDELRTIAPPSNVFRVDNFQALNNIQRELQDKIFAIEGTQSQSGSSFQLEMSQDGFSALITPDGSILGAVGAYDWSGGIFKYTDGQPSKFINTSSTSREMQDSYLGYSVQLVKQGGMNRYVIGAPRYNHQGRVLVFSPSSREGQWQQTGDIKGEQIGSYFGAELCTVDLDRDSNTDLVLIGAPMYHRPTTGGIVHVCPISPEGQMSCSQTLMGETGQLFSQFGASIADITDINGDGLTDIAIGAPTENNNQGSVYIFHGMRNSIRQAYSQRIDGSSVSPGLKFFGQSISGMMDLTRDGLVDIAVGSAGKVNLLRSQPVLDVAVSIAFQPKEIPLAVFDCSGQEVKDRKASTARVCFTVSKLTTDTLGGFSSTIDYRLHLDSVRLNSRAVFNTKNQFLNKTMRIDIERRCEDYDVYLPVCVEDSLLPITLALNFSFNGDPIPAANNINGILSEGSPRRVAQQLLFEKNCGSDGVCQDYLKIAFNYSGLSSVVVGLSLELNITVSIRNDLEDSYNTLVQLFYPAGLSYRKVTLLESNRRLMSINCNTDVGPEEAAVRKSTCNINHPIFRESSRAVFVATFDVSPKATLGDKLLVTANITSDNGGTIANESSFQAALPVRYGVYVIASSLDESTKYINFSESDQEMRKSVQHMFQVNNLGQRDLPVIVTLQYPVELGTAQVWKTEDVLLWKNESVMCKSIGETPGVPDFAEKMKTRPIVDCSVARCKRIQCNVTLLKVDQKVDFVIKGDVFSRWISQTNQQKVTLVSSAEITYDENKYAHLIDPKDTFVTSQVSTRVEVYKEYNYLPIIIGSSVGGLVLLALISAGLYKAGFFKRQYKEMLQQNDDSTSTADGPSAPATEVPT
ncbi:integrin alpha-M-like [Lissotriton helveticus]